MRRVLLATACLVALGTLWAAARPAPAVADGPSGGAAFRIGISLLPPLTTEDCSGKLNRLLLEWGRRAGLDVEFSYQPAGRSILSVNEGALDAEMPRVAGLEKRYPNLVPVPEKVLDYAFVAFTRQRDVFVETWDALGLYEVGAIVGWKFFEEHLPRYTHVTWVRDTKALFEMLARGRVDVALHEHHTGCECARSMGLSDVRELSPPLAVLPHYLYVHRRHAALVPALAEALRAMKADGSYEGIMGPQTEP